uniref:Methyltransferase domain-containing protein n=1 Tax=viral metagenome TaxID=1070528 RepID=A0A6C0J3M3_9ZZZZ
MTQFQNHSVNFTNIYQLVNNNFLDEAINLLDGIKPFKNPRFVTIIIDFLCKINYLQPSYKKKNRFIYLQVLTKHFLVQSTHLEQFTDLIQQINLCNFGQKILKIIPDFKINKLKNQEHIFNEVCKYSTLPVFLFWYNKTKSYGWTHLNTPKYKETLLIYIFANNDDRVYKYVFKNFDKIETYVDNIAQDILISIQSDKRSIKHQLRRIKFISQFTDLSKIINSIIIYSNNFTFIKNIMKYYYNKPLDLNIKDGTQNILITDHIVNVLENFNMLKEFYDLLKTSLEKNIFVFSIFTIHNTINNFNIIPCPETSKYIKNNSIIFKSFNLCINSLIIYDSLCYNKDSIINYDCISKIIKIFSQEDIINYIGIYGTDMCLNIFIPYVKYFPVQDIQLSYVLMNKNIKYNKILFYLRKFIRRKCSERKMKNHIRIQPILRELRALKPNNTKPVFNRGTDKYHLDKQKFNNVPPYHLYPNQIHNMNYQIFIKEKSDGTLVKRINSRLVYPNIIFDEEIKAEYIEDLDLYLVFDIDLKMSIQDRYSYLRNLHSNTRNFVNKGRTIKDRINRERENLKLFLQEDYESVRWYPKANFYFKFIDTDLHNWIVNIVNDIDKDLNKWLCNDGPVQNDGLIITPLTGKREIKVKPKNLMTIDLIYKDNSWFDRDDYCYDDIIMNKNNHKFDNNTIWRLYPEDNLYIPKETRFDKTRPNPRNVVSNLINLYKITYQIEIPEEIYYNKKPFDNNFIWLKIIQDNAKNIKYQLKNHNFISNILDLGCGKGKILEYFRNYQSYYGIDYDSNVLISAFNKYPNNINRFNYINLSDEWNSTRNKWCDIDFDKKYQNLFAINSLMHFCTDTFWEQLDKISQSNSIFTFNLVNDKGHTKHTFDKSYLYIKDDYVHYYFEQVHNKELKEKYISKENIQEYLDKYNWSIIDTHTSNNSNLTDYYTWYTVKRI